MLINKENQNTRLGRLMEKSIVFSHIRKTSIRHFLLPIIPIVLATLLLVTLPYRELFWPQNVNTSKEAVKAYEAGSKYVSVQPDTLYYSGYDIVTDDDNVIGAFYYDISESNQCTFYLLEVDKSKRQETINKSTYLVKFENIDGLFDNMLELLATDLEWNYADLKKVTTPVVMIETHNEIWMYHGSFFALILVLTYGAYVFLSNLMYALVPVLHPAVRKIKKFMGYDSYKELSMDLDYQVVTEVSQAGGMYITEKYFIHLGSFYVNIVPLSEIVFVYKHGQLQNLPGMHFKIKYTFHVRGNKKFRCACPGKNKEDVEFILDYFRENFPDILNGYSDENKKLAQEAIKELKEKNRKVQGEKL